MRRGATTDPAIISLLLDPIRLQRLADTSVRAHTDAARTEAGAIVRRAALALNADHSSFTLLGVEDSTAFSYGNEPATRPTVTTYCKYITTGEPFQVNNAKRHPLVCTLPVTIDYDIGSYLGVPITFAGYVLGALCVWNHALRKWTAEERSLLTSLANELTEWWKT